MLETWRALPRLSCAGLTAMGTGVLVDLTLHAARASVAPEHVAHGVILGGMVLVICGVLAEGIGRARHEQRSNA